MFFKQFITNTFEKRETKVGNRHFVFSWKHTVIIIIIPKWYFLFHHKWAVQCTNIPNMQLIDFCDIRKYMWNITCFPSVRFVNMTLFDPDTPSPKTQLKLFQRVLDVAIFKTVFIFTWHMPNLWERENGEREIEREERKREREREK